MRPNQDLPTLLEAFATVAAHRPTARLLMAAANVGELEAAAEAAGLAGKVIVQHVDHLEVPRFLNAASICVAPQADTPGMRANAVAPLKLFEYLACGRPTVTADLPFLTFVREQGLGMLYTPGRPESLASAIEALLDLSAEESRARSQHVRAYVEAHHDTKDVNARAEEFMRERSRARGKS